MLTHILRIVSPSRRGVTVTKCGASADHQLLSFTGRTCTWHESGKHKCRSNPRTSKRPPSTPRRQYRTFDVDVANNRHVVLDLAADLVQCRRQCRGGRCEWGYLSGLIEAMNEKAPALDIKDYDLYNRIRTVKGRGEECKYPCAPVGILADVIVCYHCGRLTSRWRSTPPKAE